jgi:putative hydrolase of the HAD superfamily
MTCEAVVFDLFGTLAPFSAGAFDRTLAAMAAALAVPLEDFRPLWTTAYLAQEQGIAVETALEQLCRAIGQAVDPHGISAASALFVTFERGTLAPRPEALPVLLALRQGGYRTGLISNCPTIVSELWPASPLAPHFDVVLFSCQAGLSKPDPRIYQLACTRLGVRADRCLYVGDGGSHELSGAAACGMTAVRLQPSDEDPEDALALGREPWEGATIRLLSEVHGLLHQMVRLASPERRGSLPQSSGDG